jgi:hypothetical protein
MNLVPAERTVLKLIRQLLIDSKQRSHPLAVLRSLWPPTHAPSYQGGFEGLLRKGLIAASADRQSFRITDLGLKAMKGGKESRP